ncbi:MAG: hypothetical protein L6R35_002797 [Caloplaca aegaea]|nr:MAG: hypothetical protein L6R35_002797 [Caloplaca aegaea]
MRWIEEKASPGPRVGKAHEQMLGTKAEGVLTPQPRDVRKAESGKRWERAMAGEMV